MFSNLLAVWRSLWSQQSGAAAVEFAIIVALMSVPVLNVVDIAQYAWDRMQTDNAAQAAVQAAWATCNTSTKLPATVGTNCSTMSAAVTLAVQSTTLRTAVTVTSTTEGYYCVKTSVTPNALVYAGPVTSAKPADCSAAGIGGSSSDVPGDYILITTSYTYSPIFSAVSVASGLTTPITRQAWMRLG
jgi:Flp pilus assembly protein TadG